VIRRWLIMLPLAIIAIHVLDVLLSPLLGPVIAISVLAWAMMQVLGGSGIMRRKHK